MARRSSNAASIPSDILRWLAGLILATPVLVHLAALHLNGAGTTQSGTKSIWTHMVLGVDQWQAIGMAALWGFVIALVIAGAARARSGHSQQEAYSSVQMPSHQMSDEDLVAP